MKIKVLASLSLLFLSAASFALEVRSAEINLPSGTISPHGILTFSTYMLVPNVNYNVVCKLTDPNNKSNKAILAVTGGRYGGGEISLNGKSVGVGTSQFSLPQVENTLSFTNVYTGSDMTITNSDQTDSVTVSNCVATPVE